MSVTKFIQICASQNDLFALDDAGSIYQYNFSTKTWLELLPSDSLEEGPAKHDHDRPRFS